jgi:hypothetical protein
VSLVWLDPSKENVNAGDEIIADAVLEFVPSAAEAQRITTHRLLRPGELRDIARADLVFVGGTNILRNNLLLNRQWPLPPWLLHVLRRKVVFVGVGWWQYQSSPGRLTNWALRELSHRDIPHSVRDAYTYDRLASADVSAIMTGCPTMWGLDGQSVDVSGFPEGAPVVATLTDYYFRPAEDRAWLEAVRDAFGEVLVVGMGPGDHDAYMNIGHLDGVNWLGSGTEALTRARGLSGYMVGTRLHAAVRWLQLGGHALVLAVDNRAREIGRDSGLPVCAREDVDGIKRALDQREMARVRMPVEAISDWTKRWSATLSL